MALSTTFLCWELKKCLEGPAGTQHQEVSSYALVPEKRFPKILFRKQFCKKLHIWTSQNGAKVNIERGNIEGANIFTKKIVFQNKTIKLTDILLLEVSLCICWEASLCGHGNKLMCKVLKVRALEPNTDIG